MKRTSFHQINVFLKRRMQGEFRRNVWLYILKLWDYFDTSTAGVQAFALMNSAQVRLIYIQGVYFLNCTNWLTKKNGQVIPFRTCLPPLKIGWTGKISWQLHLFSHLTTSTSGPAPLVVCWYQPKGWTNERTTMQKSQTFRFASKILKGMRLGVVINCIFF